MQMLIYALSLLIAWLIINVAVGLLRKKISKSGFNIEVKYGILLMAKKQYTGSPSIKEHVVYVYAMSAGYVIALVLTINLLATIIYTSLIRNVRSVVVLLPGLNVTGEDLIYFILAVAVGAFVHELFHAKTSLKTCIPVKSYGFILALILPVAFVEIDEEAFAKAKKKIKVAVLSAGLVANILLFFIAMAIMQFTVSPTGFTIVGVEENSLAEKSGFLINDVVYKINGSDATLEDLRNYLSMNKTTVLVFETYRPKVGFINITVLKQPFENKLGVLLAPAPSVSLVKILHPGVFIQLFKIIYWFYIVNFSLVFFNTLPLFITDGGRIAKEILGERIGNVVNYVGLSLLLLMLMLSARI
ncbi:MAG: M50 family metallopeptidase [Desulfurococcaceae archaeon]